MFDISLLIYQSLLIISDIDSYNFLPGQCGCI